MTIKLLTQLSQAEELVAEVAAAEGATEDQKTNESTKKKANELISKIRQRIIDGESTDDVALDIKIVLDRSVERDETYENLTWLHAELIAHPGELIGLPGSFGIHKLGVLPDNPTIPLRDSYIAGQHASLSIPTIRSWQGQGIIEDTFLLIQYYSLAYSNFRTPLDIVGLAYRQTVLVGDAALQQWLDAQQKPEHACDLWLSSRKLNRELKPTTHAYAKYITQRESLLPSIITVTAKYRDLKQKFSSYQNNFSVFAKNDIRYTSTPTEKGVMLEFAICKDIEKSAIELNKLLNRALGELLMHDNEDVKTACTLLGRTVE